MNLERTALFWVITQRVVVISSRRFGTNYRSHLQGSRIRVYHDGYYCVVIIKVMVLYNFVVCQHLVYYFTVLWLNSNL